MKIGFLSKTAAALVLAGMFGCGPNAAQLKLVDEIKSVTQKADSLSAPIVQGTEKIKAEHQKFVALYDSLKTAGKTNPVADSIMTANQKIVAQYEEMITKQAEALKDNKAIEEKFIQKIGNPEEMKQSLDKISGQVEELQKQGEQVKKDLQGLIDGQKVLAEMAVAAIADAQKDTKKKK